MDIQLFVKSKNDGSAQNLVIPLEHQLVLGRGPDSPVALEGTAISREHLALQLEAGTVFAIDLSNNGSWIDGKRLPRNQKHRIEDGTTIDLPGYAIEVRLVLPPATDVSRGEAPAPTKTAVVTRPVGAIPSEEESSARSRGSPFSSLVGSFTFLEKFLMLLALISFALLITYSMS